MADQSKQGLQVYMSIETPLEGSLVSETSASDLIERVCVESAKQEGLALAEVSVTIVDEKTIQELNKTYRNKDEVTDVLSFALLEGDEPAIESDDDGDTLVLGDIVICWQRVLSQAREYGHSVNRELAFLTAHGFFHLLGYDHMNEADELTMFARQEEVLMALNLRRDP